MAKQIVYWYKCCKTDEYRTSNGKPRKCKGCKKAIAPQVMKFDNVFNIKKFVKENYPSWKLSPTCIAKLYELVETIVFIELEYATISANKKKEKTLLARHFDWKTMEQFKNWVEIR